MKVLLVDDHPLFTEGLKNLLKAGKVDVVGEARNGVEALEKAKKLRPDIIFMDVMMAQSNGLEATALIKEELPEVKVVILTSLEDDETLFKAIKNGASGYMLKNSEPGEIYSMIKKLEQGEPPLSKGIALRLLTELSKMKNKDTQEEALSPEVENTVLDKRRREILALVAQGMSYKEIGDKLFLSERTIKYHMKIVLEGLHLENRSQAISYALKKGIIS